MVAIKAFLLFHQENHTPYLFVAIRDSIPVTSGKKIGKYEFVGAGRSGKLKRRGVYIGRLPRKAITHCSRPQGR